MIFKKRRDEEPVEEELAYNEEHISRDDIDIEVVVACLLHTYDASAEYNGGHTGGSQ